MMKISKMNNTELKTAWRGIDQIIELGCFWGRVCPYCKNRRDNYEYVTHHFKSDFDNMMVEFKGKGEKK